jgi:hypothetical protein
LPARPLEKAAAFDIEVDPRRIRLVRTAAAGAKSSIDLTLDDVIYLAQRLPLFLREAQAIDEQARDDDETATGFFIPAAGAEVAPDEEDGAVLLALTDEYGVRYGFSLQPGLARAIGRRFLELTPDDPPGRRSK